MGAAIAFVFALVGTTTAFAEPIAPVEPSPARADPPTPNTDSAEPPPNDTKPAAPRASTEGPDEVRVRGLKKKEATAPKETIGSREIRRLPGAFGDAFRAVEALPGVTPIVSGIPYFFVRGAPPGNTGFFIDGIRVPGLFHLGVGPAVMYPALVDRVDLYKGAYPVSFGRFAGGVISADTIRPSDRARADLTLRLFDAGALVEAPLGTSHDGADPKGTALVSGRYGYPGLLLSIFAPDAGLAYWDYQTRASYKLSDRDTISVFAFGSYDSISQRGMDADGVPDKQLTEIVNIQFHRVDLRWDRRLNSSGAIRAAVTFGYDRTASEDFSARSFVVSTRVVAEDRVSNAVQVRAGADMLTQIYRFRLGLGGSTANDVGADQPKELEGGALTDSNMATWFDVPLKLAPRVEMTPGIRSDLFTSRGQGNARAVPSFDPRLTTRIGLGPLTHVGAVGLAHQPAAFPLPIPALTFAQLRRGLQTGYHLSQGLETPLPWDFTASATTYLHTYTGLVDLASPCDSDGARCDSSSTRGRSLGLEVMLKRHVNKRVSGWLSYTLSRSTREAYDAVLRRTTSVLSQFDRTHVLNALVALDLGHGIHAGVRYAAYSGVPYSTFSELLTPNARTRAFHRIDVRFEKRWYPAPNRSFAFTAEMFNVLLMKEAIGVTCTTLPKGCQAEEIGPIAIPSIGFEGTL